MAFNLQAIAGSTTISLYDGAPFFLRRATGMAGAEIRRVTAQGPAQDGDTDLGYRLSPREMELVIGFYAATDAALDTHRDTMMAVFKPLTSTPVKLRVTRDDGEIRQIDCYTAGRVDIRLVTEHRPAHYHEATIRLRAANPVWYELAPGTVSAGTLNVATNWWLAGGAIGTAQTMDHGENPAQGAAWSYAGTTPNDGSGWTIAVRSSALQALGTIKYPYFVDSGVTSTSIWWRAGVSTYQALSFSFSPPGTADLGTAFMYNGIANYFETYLFGGTAGVPNYTHRFVAPSGTVEVVAQTHTPITGATRRWRSDAANSANSRWTPNLILYAVYWPELTNAQRQALDVYMGGTVDSNLASTLAVPYEGDVPEFPVITITGPISSPVLTNTVTGHTLDFGTITIPGGTTYTIDTRYEIKTVKAGTVNKRGELSDDSDLAEFHLAPSPIATGGTNLISVAGTATTAATQVSVVYYNRFLSF